MRKNRRLILMSIIFATALIRGYAQTLEIDFIELSGRNVVVHYDIDDGTNSNRQFLVQLFSSQDNFTTPLTRVSGDVGTEVAAGFDRKIAWDITKELGEFKGDISLEIRGRVYVPFVKIQTIGANAIFKRGKNYPLNWSSGNLSGQVNIELFNERDERIWGENNVANVGKFDWFIPPSVRKGKNYRLKFTNARDRNDVVYSKPFIIRPKIPLLAKVGGVCIIATIIELLIPKGNDPSGAQPYETPPAPPNG